MLQCSRQLHKISSDEVQQKIYKKQMSPPCANSLLRFYQSGEDLSSPTKQTFCQLDTYLFPRLQEKRASISGYIKNTSRIQNIALLVIRHWNKQNRWKRKWQFRLRFVSLYGMFSIILHFETNINRSYIISIYPSIYDFVSWVRLLLLYPNLSINLTDKLHNTCNTVHTFYTIIPSDKL